MRRLAVILAAVTLIAAACRTPGNPPRRPSQGEYQDVIRRELDSAGSALASGRLVLRYVEANRVPHTYAAVVLRQAANDLRKVAQDLREIHPLPRTARAHARLLALTERDSRLLAKLHDHLAHTPQRARARTVTRKDADLLQHLSEQLDPP